MTVDCYELARPTTEPVTLAEAKLWLRIEDDATDQDFVIQLLIGAVRELAEAITGRAFARRSFELLLDDFPDNSSWNEKLRVAGSTGVTPIKIPKPPLVSIDSVTYATSSGDTAWVGSPQMWDVTPGGDYNPARLVPVGGASWPSVEVRPGAVRIRFTAGYATASQMPWRSRAWMQQRITTLFAQRETIVVGKSVSEIPRDLIDGLLDEIRALNFFA